MALSSINISILNNPFKGYVEFISSKNSSVSNDIAYVLISRKVHGSADSYERIYEKKISNASQLDFTDFDPTSLSGFIYDYFIELTDDNSIGYNVIEFGIIYSVECWFEGLYVGNDDKQYIAHLDCNTSTTQNTQANYVTTLYGRTPYRVSNSSLNYVTGQSSGLFVPLDANNNLIYQSTRAYIDEVVQFLVDGTEKILKTSDGGMWLVSIDPTVNVTSDEQFRGSSKIEFGWTEIGDVPIIKKVATE